MNVFWKKEKLPSCNLSIGYQIVPPFMSFHTKNNRLIPDNPNSANLASAAFLNFFADYMRVTFIRISTASPDQRIELKPFPNPIDDDDLESILLPPVFRSSTRTATLLPKHTSTDSDVFQTFREFSSIWWLLIALQLMLFLAFYIIINRTKHSNFKLKILGSLVWSIVGCIFSQSYVIKLRKSPRYILLLLSVFLFFTLAYFGAQFSTDLVVERKSFTIDTLEDLFDSRGEKYTPYFRKTSQILRTYENSDLPIKRRIAKKCRQIGLNDCTPTVDVKSLSRGFGEFNEKPRVTVDFDFALNTFASFYCRVIRLTNFDDNRSLYIGKYSLGDELLFWRSSFVNDSCKSTKRRITSHYAYLTTESGRFQAYVKDLQLLRIFEPKYDWNCEKGVDFTDKIKSTLSMDKLVNLFVIYACLMLFGLAVFIIEILYSHLH